MLEDCDRIRCFFAINLPAQLKAQLEPTIAYLKKNSLNESIRWSNLNNLHITLQFIGELLTKDIPGLLANVEHRLKQFTSFEITLDKIEFFPNESQPRVLSLRVLPKKELSQLVHLIGEEIVRSGYAIENRPFRGHLTLARFKKKPEFIVIPNYFIPIQLKINQVIFYKSETRMDGSLYTPLHTLSFEAR